MNPILNGMPNPNMAKIKNMFQAFKAAGNPQAMIQNMMKNNPNINEINKLVQTNGSYEQAFRAKAKEMGIDPDEFIKNMN